MDMESFLARLRVLAVDDDRVCLKILETQLRHCKYNVTAVTRAEAALEMLRARKDGDQFDLVISDVHMPDMDGFKLLELVGLEMDIPVIMLSANEEMETMMKGIKHGACDYLVKPVHLDRLKNIWLHVVKKSMNDPRDHISGANDDASQKRQSGDAEDEKNGADDTKKHSRKNKKDGDDPEEDSENTSTQKRQRIQWSADLHRKFVEAVHQIGIDRAVPKKILDVMGVDGITREHVASHLQKYRLALKKLSLGTDKQSNPCPAGTESWRRDWNYINMNGLASSPSALGTHRLLHSQSVKPISSQRSLGIPVRDMGPAGNGGNLLNAVVHDVSNVTSGNSYGNISNGGLPSGSGPSGSYIENIRNRMVLDADRSFPFAISGNSFANMSNGTQLLVPGLVSNSLKGDVLSMFPGYGPSQGNNLKINQLSGIAASSGQMTAIGNEIQNRMAALKGKSTPEVDFSEQMAPFNLGNYTSVPINNSALASAPTIRSALPDIQIGNLGMLTQMLNGGGATVNVLDEKDGTSKVYQHATGDLVGTSEAQNQMGGDLDDFFIDGLI